MRCEAEIILDQVDDVLSVPLQAVFHEAEASFIYRPRGSKYERVLVAVGRCSDLYAEILGGLDESDRVLLREPEIGFIIDEEFPQDVLASLASLEAGAQQAIAEAIAQADAKAAQLLAEKDAGDAQSPNTGNSVTTPVSAPASKSDAEVDTTADADDTKAAGKDVKRADVSS